jgi:hypothetical protein
MKLKTRFTLSLLFLACTSITAVAQCYVDPFTGQRYCTGSCPTCPTCRPSRQVVVGTPAASANAANVDSSSHCRITVGGSTLGSGTLVDRDDSIGLVLTCAHLFDESISQIIVAFPHGGRFVAKLVDIDHAQDLAALAIRRPDVDPLLIATSEPAGTLVACGFGPHGVFASFQGVITGQATAVGASYASTTIAGAVRPGDSGGAVLNTSGQVVGVVWGQRDGQTYATCGRPVCDFLTRVRDKVFPKVVVANKVPAANSTPTPPPQTPSPQPPNSSPQPQPDWRAFATRHRFYDFRWSGTGGIYTGRRFGD